jgi:hypothetical protein
LIGGVREARSLGGGGFQGVVAEGFEDVVAAFEQFAGEREARTVAADPLGELKVVLAVGAGGEPRSLRGFIERPAQRGGPWRERCPGARRWSDW